MKVPFIDLHRAHSSMLSRLQGVISKCISENEFILGKYTLEFEEAWSKFCGNTHSIGCSNGTDALTLILRALGIGGGDKVATVSHTFFATIEAIVQVGAIPVLVDIDPATGLMNIESAKDLVMRREVTAIIPVHLYGNPIDLSELSDLCKQNNVWLIEDASQAHGATIGDQAVGTFGIASAFSCYPSKNLGAMGDAGIISTSDSSLAEELRCLRDHGQKEKANHSVCAYNMRLDGIQAAILLEKLQYLNEWNEQRRKIVDRYNSALSNLENVKIVPHLSGSACHLFVILTQNRHLMIDQLTSKGIGTGIHYPTPVHMQQGYRRKFGEISLQHTEDFSANCLSLPLFPQLTDTEIDYVIEGLLDFNF